MAATSRLSSTAPPPPWDAGLRPDPPEAARKRLMAVRRRQFERHPFRLPVTVVWGDTCLETCTHTLALGGLFAVCGDPPPAGTAVSVSFRLPDPDGEVKLRLAGEVVYTTSEGIGVRFLDLDREARGKLRTFFILQDLHCYNTETMEP